MVQSTYWGYITFVRVWTSSNPSVFVERNVHRRRSIHGGHWTREGIVPAGTIKGLETRNPNSRLVDLLLGGMSAPDLTCRSSVGRHGPNPTLLRPVRHTECPAPEPTAKGLQMTFAKSILGQTATTRQQIPLCSHRSPYLRRPPGSRNNAQGRCAVRLPCDMFPLLECWVPIGPPYISRRGPNCRYLKDG
jgi:hypothetical protein